MTTYSEKLRKPAWQKKRLEILNRDSFTCQLCGDTETELQIHHKKYVGEPHEAPNDELVTLCKHCHQTVTELETGHDKVIFVIKNENAFFAKMKSKAIAVGKIDNEGNLILSLLLNKPLEFLKTLEILTK